MKLAQQIVAAAEAKQRRELPSTPEYHEELRTDPKTKDQITVLICDECGGERVSGDWPDCRKDGNHTAGHGFDDPLEAYDDHNVDVNTRRITTRGERRAIMSKNHLEYVKKGQRLGAIRYIDLGRLGR